MESNEIKKALYKQKPDAKYTFANKDGIYYGAAINVDGLDHMISFLIPFSDIGDALFFSTMEAHLLIRYLIKNKTDDKEKKRMGSHCQSSYHNRNR